MKRTFLAAIMVFLVLSTIGCGHHDHGTQIFTSSTISNQNFDGDIALDPTTGFSISTIAGGAQSVRAGIDATNTEFRAFLDFPLSGGVPLNAVIDSASLDIVIDNVSLRSGNTIPIRIDLIDIPSLTVSNYALTSPPPISSITINIFQSDVGSHVIIDVTSLMKTAQNQGLADFQIRILEDLGPVIYGFIDINDTTATTADRNSFAPLLQVNYF